MLRRWARSFGSVGMRRKYITTAVLAALTAIVSAIPLLLHRMNSATFPKMAIAVTEHESMEFIVEEVFYIKPPVDRVILIGIVRDGSVKAGKSVIVHTSSGPVDATVEVIETINRGDIEQATAGEQVGLRLTNIRKDQPTRGDRVTDTLGGGLRYEP